MKNEKEKEIKYFSMFTGVGGFELGFERANDNQSQATRYESKTNSSSNTSKSLQRTSFSCIGFSEIDKYANELLKQKFPEIKNYGDTTKIVPKELPDFQLLVGGFPCQAFSIAGKRKGFEDTRGTLFHDIVRILKVKRPNYLLLENVKGLLSHDNGRTFAIILASLSELGYVIQWMVLNSKFFGVPQNRERVFIIGSLREKPIPEILPFRETDREFNKRDTKHQIASSLQHPGHSGGNYRGMNMIQRVQIDVSGKGYNSQQDRIYLTEGVMGCLPNANPDSKMNIAILTPDKKNKRQHGRKFKKEGEPSFTLTGQDIHGVAIMRGRPKIPYEHGKRELKYTIYKDTCPTLSQNCASGDQKNIVVSPTLHGFKPGTHKHFNEILPKRGLAIRRLTPIECERLQGFPDNWTNIKMENGKMMSDTQRYKMMGNAVTVNVIQAIVERMFK